MTAPAAMHRSFLDAIIAAPDDETPRLIYADYLEDNGEPQRAEFIRVQLKKDRACRASPLLDDWHWSRLREVLDDHNDWGRSRAAFLREQREVGTILDEEAYRDYARHHAASRKLRREYGQHWNANLEGLVIESGFRRGLVERVRMTASSLADNAEELSRVAPVLEVMLDRCDRGLDEALARPELANLTHLHLAEHYLDVKVGRALRRAKSLSRLSSLWLECSWLGDEGLEHLANSPHLAGLTELHLEANHLSDRGLRALTASPYLTRLRKLYLGGNWDIRAPGAEALAEWRGLNRLEMLDLAACGLKYEGIKALAESPNLSQLTTLYLHDNDIGPAGVRTLAGMKAPCLEILDLSDNRPEESIGHLVDSDLVGHLRFLGLADCELGPDVDVLADSPRLRNLLALDLSGNAIGASGLEALLQSPNLRNLLSLNLRDNALDAGSLALPAKSTLGRLARLVLDRNDLGDAGVKRLAAWPGLATLEVLRLEDTGMGDAGAAELALSPHLDALLELSVVGNRLSPDGQAALRERWGEAVLLGRRRRR